MKNKFLKIAAILIAVAGLASCGTGDEASIAPASSIIEATTESFIASSSVVEYEAKEAAKEETSSGEKTSSEEIFSAVSSEVVSSEEEPKYLRYFGSYGVAYATTSYNVLSGGQVWSKERIEGLSFERFFRCSSIDSYNMMHCIQVAVGEDTKTNGPWQSYFYNNNWYITVAIDSSCNGYQFSLYYTASYDYGFDYPTLEEAFEEEKNDFICYTDKIYSASEVESLINLGGDVNDGLIDCSDISSEDIRADVKSTISEYTRYFDFTTLSVKVEAAGSGYMLAIYRCFNRDGYIYRAN